MAREFDGSGDYIILNKSAAATDLSQVSYAYTYWKDSFSGAYREIFWSGGSWSTNYHTFIQHDLSNYMVFTANWTNTEGRWSIDNPTDNTWVNEVVTYDFGSTSNDPVWYRNGVAQSLSERITPSGSADYAKDDGTLTIGAYDDGSAEIWDGRIAYLAIWNRILSSDEAVMLGKGFSPLFLSNGLVSFIPLNGNNSTEYDIIGGGSGSVVGAIKAEDPPIIHPE